MNLFTKVGLEHLGSEPRDIAQWAHRLVWTDRMLETLLSSERREVALAVRQATGRCLKPTTA
jgi:hypothetical protein